MKCILTGILLVIMLLFSIFLAVRPIAFSSTLSLSYALLGAGAKWAANGGTKAAYIDFYDNLIAHPNPNWGSNAYYHLPMKNEVLSVLEDEGFTVDTFADIPSNLSQYNLLYLEAYFACEPANEPAIRSYISNGGGLSIFQGAIAYLAHYSNTSNIDQDLSSVAPWFGASYFVDTGGTAYANVANPFGTSLKVGDQIGAFVSSSITGITSMSADSQVVAVWDDGSTFGFTHEYGQGRVYWQATVQSIQQFAGSNKALSLTLYGGFDYGATEQARVKVFAELRDPVTMEPISGANVTIQIFDPSNALWVSASMIETMSGTGIYEWESADTVANMEPQVGVYLTRVAASTGGPSASEILPFHIDPPANPASPANPAGNVTFQLYLAIVALVLGGMLIVSVLLRKPRLRVGNARPNKILFFEK